MGWREQTWAYEQRTGCPLRKSVLNAIADRADRTGYAHPSLGEIWERTEIKTVRTVQRKIRELEEMGLLRIEARYMQKGGQTSNAYWLNLSQLVLPMDTEDPPLPVEEEAEEEIETGDDTASPPPDVTSPSPRLQGHPPPDPGVIPPLTPRSPHELSTTNENTNEEKKGVSPSPPPAPDSNQGREALIAFTGVDPLILDAIPDGGPGWENRLLRAFGPETATRPGVEKLWRRVRPEDRPGVFRQMLEDYADPSKGERGPYKPRRMERFLVSAVGEYLRPVKVGRPSPAEERRIEEERRANIRPSDGPTRLEVPSVRALPELTAAEEWLAAQPPPRQRVIEAAIDETIQKELGVTKGLSYTVRRGVELVKRHQRATGKAKLSASA